MKTRAFFLKVAHPLRGLWRSLVLLGAAAAWVSQASQTQSIRLDPGWNLVSFQVVPPDASPAVVFGTLGTAFERAFAYSNPTKAWTSFSRAGATDANRINPMSSLDVGQAYWVFMNQVVPQWQIIGDPPAITPAINFSQGWNLVGLPTGAGTLSEPVNMLSVLAVSGFDYDVILRWERTLYAKFTPADGDVDDFTTFDPNRGFWVNVKSASFSLQPKLLASVRGDQDIEPVGNYPSPEDLRLSESPTPLGPNEQTHIVFLPGEDVQQLALANTGGGILLWELAVTNAPWLVVSATRGVTTIENDVINLYLDRRSLQKGTYQTTVTLRTTAGERVFRVVANVPGLGGDWRGEATILTANGRHNPLPQIDLHLSFFEDPVASGLVRGLIDSQNALLWPVDVSLLGHVGANGGDALTLAGGFVLPPGDVNNAPFKRFDGMMEDLDWNCNGKLDAVNPYPFPVYRAVSINGRLTAGTSANGYTIEGEYSELIYGMLRDPIHLKGIFTVRRDNAVPFASRRPVANQESALGTVPVVLKTYQPGAPQNLPAGRSTNALNVVTDLALERVSVDLDIGDAPAIALKISLLAPSGQSVVLHDRADIASLHSLSFPSNRRPRQSLDRLASDGVITRGNWTLVVENNGAAVAHLFSWSLRLSGQPLFNLSGQVVDDTGQPLAAQVFLDGLAGTEVAASAGTGVFNFSRVPGIPMNFSASLAGYQPLVPGVPGVGTEFTIPHFTMDCGNAVKLAAAARFRALPVAPVPGGGSDGFGTNSGTAQNPFVVRLKPRAPVAPGTPPQLLATPAFGYAPMTAMLAVYDPAAVIPAATTLLWNYGDGTANESGALRAREHTFTQSRNNGYLVQVVGGSQSLQQRVYPMPSPGNSPYVANFFQVSFTAGGTIPAGLASTITGSNDVTRPAPLVPLLQVQQAYCASFDIDLAPKTTVGGSFFTDNFDPLATINLAANRAGNFRDEDYNYQVADGIGPGQWSMAAICGYAVADTVYHPHPRPGQTGDCALPRFQMLCNIGPTILPSTASEVYAVMPGDPPVFPSAPDPLEATGANGLATSRQLRMITGPLAAFWNQ